MRLARPRAPIVWAPIVFAASFVALATASCAQQGTGPFGTTDDAGTDTPTFGSDGSAPSGPCVNLQCQRVDCGGGPKTWLHGTVHTGGLVEPDPVYNAIVYIPNETPQAFDDNVVCDHCGVITSGKPVAAAVTAADGSFTLEDVPVGNNIPLVVQLGKWRRQVVIPTVSPCQANELDDSLTRFPRNRSEGDIPRVAIATGFIDPIECVLRKMGIDDAEFTVPTDQGRIHLYDSNGATEDGTPSADDLWNNLDALKRYDMVLLPCEGKEVLKTPEATQNMIDYSALGGRVLASHYGYVWIARAQMPFPSTADWMTNQPDLDSPLPAVLNRSFPKGQAMADWLRNQGASDVLGQISIDAPRHDLGSPRNGSLAWISAADDPGTVLHLTFNTPIGADTANQCGRVVYSDFHVTPTQSVAAPFPSECEPGPMLPTERVLEFMLFDLETCIQDDNEYPKPPAAR